LFAKFNDNNFMSNITDGPMGITIKSQRELDLMREAGKVVAKAKAAVKSAICPGVTSQEMDYLA
jgi:methionine aminopeptidase